jgi:hypothetical protein
MEAVQQQVKIWNFWNDKIPVTTFINHLIKDGFHIDSTISEPSLNQVIFYCTQEIKFFENSPGKSQKLARRINDGM